MRNTPAELQGEKIGNGFIFMGKSVSIQRFLIAMLDKRFLSWGDLAEKNSDLAEGDKVVVEADEQEGDYHIVTALKKFEAE